MSQEKEPGRARILVVDDEENVVATMQAILEMDGHQVDTIQTGQEAIEMVKAEDYDVVLTDLRLEDVSGQDVLAAVRRERPGTVTIMLTGYASLESAIAALREGVYDYLLKPSDPDELRATVQRAIERRRLLRRVAELQELDDLKSQFLSMASHELRTPITAVSGFAQLALRGVRERLRAGKPDEEAWSRELDRLTRQLQIIEDQSAKLGRLVRELLDVSRIQAGRLEFELVPVDVADVAQAVAEQMQMISPRHRLETHARGTTTVMGDRDHLDQVLANLLDNAVKYSPEGGPVDVRVWSERDEVRILVEDRGIGIPSEQLERVFDLFYRTSDAESRRTPGLGLGLYITKGIVERHGGRIWLESEPGGGTRVHVTLPAEHAKRRVRIGAGRPKAEVTAT